MFWFLAVAIAISLGLYVYFVGHTVYTAVERQKAERLVATLESNAEKLEIDYLGMKALITKEVAFAKGFKEISSAVKYISRNSAKSLSLSNGI